MCDPDEALKCMSNISWSLFYACKHLYSVIGQGSNCDDAIFAPLMWGKIIGYFSIDV